MTAKAALAFNLGECGDVLAVLPFLPSTFWPMRPFKIAENSLMGAFRFAEPVLR